MDTINIVVQNKIACLLDMNSFIVCGNKNYTINFSFDEEWDEYEAKTARFKWGGKCVDVVFTGNQCPAPVILDTKAVKVGVYAGDLYTTTSANIRCISSIRCGKDAPVAPTPEVYDQIMQMINDGMLKGEDGIDGKDGVDGKDGADLYLGETSDTAYAGDKGKALSGRVSKSERDIAFLYAIAEQGGAFTKTTVSDAFNSRVTAGGLNIVDGSPTTLKKVVGNTVACKNLIPYPYVVLEGAYAGLTYKAKNDGSFLLKGKSTNAQSIILATIELSSNTYYFKNSRNGNGAYAFIKRANGTRISSDQSFVVEEKETVEFGFYTGYENEVDYIVYPMLSTENISWQPYFTGLKSASFGGIESTNADGTETSTIAFTKTPTPLGTTIDFENKKITDYGVDLVLTGTENWAMRGQVFNDVNQFYSLLLDDTKYNFGEGVCTDFDRLTALINEVGFAIGSMNAALYLSVEKTQFTSVEDLKAWLAQRYADGNPVTIRYVSSTFQSETDFTADNEYTAYKGGTEKVLDNDGAEFGAENTIEQVYYTMEG